jgi:hypothetical protein
LCETSAAFQQATCYTPEDMSFLFNMFAAAEDIGGIGNCVVGNIASVKCALRLFSSSDLEPMERSIEVRLSAVSGSTFCVFGDCTTR